MTDPDPTSEKFRARIFEEIANGKNLDPKSRGLMLRGDEKMLLAAGGKVFTSKTLHYLVTCIRLRDFVSE